MMARLAPVTPGELLLEEFLAPMGISKYRLARKSVFRPSASARSLPAGAPSPRTPTCACAGSSAFRTATGFVRRRPTIRKSPRPHWRRRSSGSSLGRGLRRLWGARCRCAPALMPALVARRAKALAVQRPVGNADCRPSTFRNPQTASATITATTNHCRHAYQRDMSSVQGA